MIWNSPFVSSIFKISLGIFWFAMAAQSGAATPEWLTPNHLLWISWLALAAYWLGSALQVKRTARRQPSGERMVHLLIMVTGFILLYDDSLPWNFLYRRFLPQDIRIEWLGAIITFGGAVFAIWARRTIGKDWSAEVQIKQGHELIRTGPYRYVRHPIYTGFLAAVAGAALYMGQYRAIIAFVIVLIGFARKAKREEAFLASEFGAKFDEHLRRTGFFLPKFR